MTKEVSEESGFHAEGWNEDRVMMCELTTGKRPGDPVRLRRWALDEEWKEAGEVVAAIERD